MFQKFIPTIWVIFLFSLTTNGQSTQDYILTVDEITPEEGLAHRKVGCIHEDDNGFLWFGGKKGLQKYDGQSFKTWENNLLEDLSNIKQDDEGWFWLWNNKLLELVFFHPDMELILTKEERFSPPHSDYKFPDLKSDQHNLSILIVNDKGQICIGLEEGKILTYDKKSGFQFINTKIKDKIKLNYQDSEGNYWLSSQYLDTLRNYNFKRAIYKISPEGRTLFEYLLGPQQSANFFPLIEDTMYVQIMTYTQDSQTLERFKIATNGDRIKVGKENRFGFGEIIDKSVWVQNSRESWEIFDIQSKKLIYQLTKDQYTDDLFVYSEIKYVDSRGYVWMAGASGLLKLHFRKNKFKNYFSFDEDEKPFPNSVRGIYADHNSLLLSCEVDQTVQVSKLGANNWDTFSNLRWGRPLVKLDNEEVCIGYESKLIFYSPRGEYLRALNISQNQSVPVWTLYDDHSSELWIGCNGFLKRYNYINNTLQNFEIIDEQGKRVESKELHNVFNIIPEGENKLWLCTTNGLRLIDIESHQQLKYYSSNQEGDNFLPANTFFHLYKDNENVYWIGTSEGLIKSNLNNDSKIEDRASTSHYELFDKKFGFPNDVIYAVFEDDHQRLWMSSNYGIISLDKKTLAINSYNRKDGTSSDEFNKTSFFRDNEGTIYFGGLNGVTSFNPDDFDQGDQQHPKMLITDYVIFDGEQGGLINKSSDLREQKRIDFYPNDRYFRLDFELATFNNDDNLSYAWKIDGMHSDWNYQDENSVQVGMLPYGKHSINIKGKSNKTGWSPHQLSIVIHVFKPFYLQTWFILFCLISLVFGIVAFFKIRTRVLKREIEKATQKIQSDKQIIEQQAEDLKELDKVKSRFFANVSHELRTPLSLMLGPMKNLLEKDIFIDKDRKLLDLMHGNTLKLRSIVNELLDLSKLENKKMELVEEPVEFYEYINNYVTQYASFGNRGKKVFKSNIPDNIKSYIKLDKAKFEKVINNFFSNAMKFSPENGIVKVLVTDLDDSIQIAITDNGIGIDPRDLPKVFDRFYQSKRNTAKLEGGTGIGLAFCKELAELMNGSVWAESTLGEGSTFYFKFKKNKVEEMEYCNALQHDQDIDLDTIDLPKVKGQKIDKVKSKKHLQILIAEDNSDLRAYYQIILDAYDVILFENGKLALDHLNSSKRVPDLIISDLMMPVMDGLELITKLKSNDSFRHIPLIVLTAKTDRNIKIKALRIGIDDYINKPFDSEELLVRIENITSRSELKLEEYDTHSTKVKSQIVSEEEMHWLASLETIILKHINSDILTLSYLSNECAMSPSTLQRHLKKLTGLTATKYIQEHRLNFARELLQNRKYRTIAQVAYNSGFKEPNSFARSFKNRFGARPTDLLG